jgi:hypothetical protein
LTGFQLGRFDTPGIFAIRDAKNLVYYRNYETYHGSNFKVISEDFITAINKGEKQPLYGKWVDSIKNIPNLEYWKNHLLKSYIYSIGLIALIFLPIILFVDIFLFPVLGRGPRSSKDGEPAPKHIAVPPKTTKIAEKKIYNGKPKQE